MHGWWPLDGSGLSSNDEMLVPGCNTKRLNYYISKPAWGGDHNTTSGGSVNSDATKKS
jgi:hypothetical protein